MTDRTEELAARIGRGVVAVQTGEPEHVILAMLRGEARYAYNTVVFEQATTPTEHPAHSGHEYGGGYARAAALAAGDPDWMNATGGTPTYDCPRCGNDPEDCYCNDEDMIAFREAGGFRRTVQGEPTAHRFEGESDPIATNPILRGVDLALERLVRRDCFTERTLRILDELRAEVLGVSTPAEVREHYATKRENGSTE